MDWVFIVFALGTLIYAIIILKEYAFEARVQRDLQHTLLRERAELEDKIQEQKEEEGKLKVQIEEIKQAIKEQEDIVRKREGEIRSVEESMAKRGKYRV